MKQLQDKKAAIEVAITNEHDKEVKKRLQAEKAATADEVKLRKQVAIERPEVLTQGAGAKAGIMGTGRQMIGDVGGSLANAIPGGDALMGIVSSGPGAAVAALGLVGKGLMDIGMKYDEAFDTIRVKTGATGELAEELNQSFKNAYANSAEDSLFVAETIGELNQRLGLTGEPLEKMAAQFSDLKTMGIEANLEGVATAMQAWNVPTDQQSEKLDTLFKISQATGTTVDDLSAQMQTAGPAMKSLGFSFEESAAMLGKWKKEGIDADAAIAGLTKANAKFAKDGIPVREGLMQTVEAIKNAKSGTDALAIANDTFGAKGGGKMMTMIKEGKFELDDFLSTIEKSPESIDKAARATEDFPEKMARVGHGITNALEPIGSGMMDMIGAALDVIGPMVQNLIASVTPFIESLITKLTPAFEVVTSAVGPLLDVLGFLWDVWVAILEPLIDVQLFLVGAMYEAVADIIEKGIEFVAWVTDAWAVMQGWGEWLTGAFQSSIDWLSGALEDVSGYVSDLADTIIDRLVGAFEYLTGLIDSVGGVFSWFTGLIGDGIAWVGKLGGSLSGLGGFFDGLLKPIHAVIGAIGEVIGAVSDAVGSIGGLIGITGGGGGGGSVGGTATIPGGRGGAGGVRIPIPVIPGGSGGGAPGGGGGGGRGGSSGGGRPKGKKTDPFQKAVDAEDADHKKEMTALTTKWNNGDIATVEEYSQQQRDLQRDHYGDLKDIHLKYKKDVGEIDKDISELDRIERELREKTATDIAKKGGAALREATAESRKQMETDAEADHKADEAELAYQQELAKKKIDVMTDGLDKQLAQEEMRWQAERAKYEGHLEMLALIDEEHATKKAGIILGNLKAEDAVYQSGYSATMAGVKSTVSQGLAWMDASWKKGIDNQNTALFQILSSVTSALSGVLDTALGKLAEKAAVFIGENLAMAGSAILSGLASIWSWFLATGPWGWAGAAALTGIVVSQWDGLKETMGFADGGIASSPIFGRSVNGRTTMAGEAGPELIAPLATLPRLIAPSLAMANQGVQQAVIDLRSDLRALAMRPMVVEAPIYADQLAYALKQHARDEAQGAL
jgi:phage-related minor tail protein